MSRSARLFFLGSCVVSGLTVFGVNYYIDEEKQRKRVNILSEISRREEKHRLNMDEYQQQLKLQQILLEQEKLRPSNT